jgi:hypothetical protein
MVSVNPSISDERPSRFPVVSIAKPSAFALHFSAEKENYDSAVYAHGLSDHAELLSSRISCGRRLLQNKLRMFQPVQSSLSGGHGVNVLISSRL